MALKISRLVRHFDELTLVGSFLRIAALEQQKLQMVDAQVLAALRRVVPDLAEAPTHEISHYLNAMEPAQLAGLTQNLKGVLHELEFVRIENADGDSVHAVLFDDPAHPVTDVSFFDEQTGDTWEAQLKATESANIPNAWLHDHPDGQIFVTEELADRSDLPSSGLSNHDLYQQTEAGLRQLADQPVPDMWDHLPVTAPVGMGLAAWLLWQRKQRGEISAAEFQQQLPKALAVRGAKVVGLTWLLMTPLGPLAAAWLIFRTLDVGPEQLKALWKTLHTPSVAGAAA
jgi:hypothetical protein